MLHVFFMKRIRAKSKTQLSALNSEIQREKSLLQQNNLAMHDLLELIKDDQYKLDHIKVEIVEIDFTLKEICKFI